MQYFATLHLTDIGRCDGNLENWKYMHFTITLHIRVSVEICCDKSLRQMMIGTLIVALRNSGG